jgi:benzoate/toluate 1,2-dioxygenase alpha subunit
MNLRLTDLIDDRPDEGVFRVNRAIFTEQRVFDAEIHRLFEGGWIFLGLESQAGEAHDFFTTYAGRVPILVQRDGEGILRGFINSCPHKGARLAQVRQGNARLHVCPYHSWSFDSAGRNRAVKWKGAGCYAQAFDQDDHGLAHLPQFANYRGFLFGSLAADVPPLADYLGEAAKLLDLVADQSADGVELVPGQVTFTFEANWKLQLENCSDAYHFTSAHPSYIRVLERRQKELSADVVASVWENSDYWKEDTQGIGGGS